MLYLSRIFVPDAFVALDTGKVKLAVLSSLEITRARKTSAFDEVLPFETVRTASRKHFKSTPLGVTEMVRWLMRHMGVEHLQIAADFPAAIALELKAARVPLEIVLGPLYPERIRKSDTECREIRKANTASAAGIRAAEKTLRAATVKNGYLYHKGRRLTSEVLRTAIDTACLEHGAVAIHTIVAGGKQACDPHAIGHGPLRAESLIIVDVFPRLAQSGYHGDMTRTFLKGRASEAQKALVATVRQAQQRALACLRTGIRASEVHETVKHHFDTCGYPTETRNSVPVGFFHSTGHGLGLDIHEAPRLGNNGDTLTEDMVVTVEPGLYYPGLGGCRIEDVARISTDGHQLLSKLHYRWQLP